MWIAAICGAVAAVPGLFGAIIGREVSAVTQRQSGERIAATNATAAKSNEAAATAGLKLEQFVHRSLPGNLIGQRFSTHCVARQWAPCKSLICGTLRSASMSRSSCGVYWKMQAGRRRESNDIQVAKSICSPLRAEQRG
jgi:hypothetical protein